MHCGTVFTCLCISLLYSLLPVGCYTWVHCGTVFCSDTTWFDYLCSTHECIVELYETIEFFLNYELTNFVKLVKLVKTFNHSTKIWWELNPGPIIISLMFSQATELSVWPVPQKITTSMYYHAWLISSNLANWVNLTKEGWIKGKLECIRIAQDNSTIEIRTPSIATLVTRMKQ